MIGHPHFGARGLPCCDGGNYALRYGYSAIIGDQLNTTMAAPAAASSTKIRLYKAMGMTVQRQTVQVEKIQHQPRIEPTDCYR